MVVEVLILKPNPSDLYTIQNFPTQEQQKLLSSRQIANDSQSIIIENSNSLQTDHSETRNSKEVIADNSRAEMELQPKRIESSLGDISSGMASTQIARKRGLSGAGGSAAAATAAEEQIPTSEPSKSSPFAVYGELWEEKEKRIRAKSIYGALPNWGLSWIPKKKNFLKANKNLK